MALAMRMQRVRGMRVARNITKMIVAGVRCAMVGVAGVAGVGVAEVGVLRSEIGRRGARAVDGGGGGDSSDSGGDSSLQGWRFGALGRHWHRITISVIGSSAGVISSSTTNDSRIR